MRVVWLLDVAKKTSELFFGGATFGIFRFFWSNSFVGTFGPACAFESIYLPPLVLDGSWLQIYEGRAGITQLCGARVALPRLGL